MKNCSATDTDEVMVTFPPEDLTNVTDFLDTQRLSSMRNGASSSSVEYSSHKQWAAVTTCRVVTRVPEHVLPTFTIATYSSLSSIEPRRTVGESPGGPPRNVFSFPSGDSLLSAESPSMFPASTRPEQSHGSQWLPSEAHSWPPCVLPAQTHACVEPGLHTVPEPVSSPQLARTKTVSMLSTRLLRMVNAPFAFRSSI